MIATWVVLSFMVLGVDSHREDAAADSSEGGEVIARTCAARTEESTDTMRLLLSEGLDLCARARSLDRIERDLTEWQMRNSHMTKSATAPLWAQEQYERDLAEWEARARKALTP